MRTACLLLLVASVTWAQEGGAPATVPLLQGRAERVTLTPRGGMFGVLSAPGDGGVEHLLVTEQAFLEDVHLRAPREATVTVVRLLQPRRAQVTVTVTDAGLEVTGAAVERTVLPPAHEGQRAERSFVLQRHGLDVLEVTDIIGSGCPTVNATTLYRLHGARAEALIRTRSIGEAGYHQGTMPLWGGPPGAPTWHQGFPKLQLVRGVPPGRHLTIIDEVVEADVMRCSTRRRYRYTGEALKLLDVTHAPDAGCPLPE